MCVRVRVHVLYICVCERVHACASVCMRVRVRVCVSLSASVCLNLACHLGSRCASVPLRLLVCLLVVYLPACLSCACEARGSAGGRTEWRSARTS